MPFAFLVPLFLAGFAALAIPVVLHLRRRDRQKPTPFPSLMFLSRLPTQTDHRRRITDWPLLILRALALALLVFAFARPYLQRSDVTRANPVGLTVLLLDRSASMDAVGVREAWADSARAVIEGLPSGRRIAIVAFDASATVLLEPTDDHAAARAVIGTTPAAAGATRFAAGLRAAANLLAHEPLPGDIVLVSDLQRSGLAATSAPALPSGTTLRTIAVDPDSRDNAAVLAIEVQSVPADEARRAVVAARIDRHGGEAPRTTEAVLIIDGREISTAAVILPADGTARVVFDTVTLARAEARVTIRVGADALPSDDARHLVVPAELATRVTLVAAGNAQPDEWRYVEQALRIGRDPVFTVERVSRLDRATIDRSAAIVLFDAAVPEGEVATALEAWLRAGGGLVVVAGERLAGRRGGLDPLTATLRGNVDRREGAVLGDAETSHPALSAFREERSDAFAAVRVRRHAVIDAPGDGAVLLRFDDGSPALIAGASGAGRTMLVAIPLDARRGDFPLQPAFLPFLRGVVGWAAGHGAGAPSQESGEPWLAPVSLRTPVVRSPSGDLARPVDATRFVVLREAGFHEAFEGRAGGLPAGVIAVNAPAAESDLTKMAAEELLLGVAELPSAGEMSPPELASAREARQRGWRWLLLAFLVVLGVETVVASRGWRGVAARSPAISSNGGTPR
jgi:hypothetical protein